ncbi:hypothetical protein ACS386_09220 [Flavobacteriaceae bacterium LMO-SS05]
MRKLIFIVLIISVSCNSNLKFLNKYDGYKGKPKKVVETSYRIEYNDTVFNENYTGKIIVFYDSKGRKIKTMLYKSDNTLSVAGIYYKYDQQGNEIESIMYNLDSTINSKNNYKYNKYGQQIENILMWGNNIKSITKSNFDRLNRKEEVIGKNGDGGFQEYSVQNYDDKWNVTELISYDSIGNQETRIEFEYDKNGNKNSSKWFNARNELNNIYKTTFDKQNHPIMSFSYRIKGKDTILERTEKIEYKYYDNNNIRERKFFSNNKPTYILRYKYVW